MAINLYDFHDIVRETYNEYVSRYEIDLVDFKNEYGTDSEPKFIEYQRVYLGKMRDYIIENLCKIDIEDLDSQFYHDKLQEALSDNKKMFQFLNVRLNPMNYIPEQKENTSKDEYLEFFENLNNNKITESGMIKFIKSHESILELETLIKDIEAFDKNYYAENLVYNLNKRDLSESFTTFKELVLNKIDELKSKDASDKLKTKNDFTQRAWFKTGLLFAEWKKLEKFITVNGVDAFVFTEGFTAPKVAEELKDKSLEKYILGTVNGYTTDKNIFRDSKKIEIIHNYCEENKIIVCDYFINKYNEKVLNPK